MVFLLMATYSLHSSGQFSNGHHTTKVNGIDLYYEVYGEGEPLLLLHGWTQSSQFWREYIPQYAEHFQVIAIDLRGHGKTSMLSSEFSIKKAADDILGLLDHLGIKKANAIGLSYGGLTLLELANLNPERIESMILIGASHEFNGADNDDNIFTYDSLPPSFIKQLNETHLHGETQIRALFNPNLNYQLHLDEETLQKFNFRTLIVQGDRDEILGVEPAIELHKHIPNSELWIVPNTGHNAIIGANKENFLSLSLQFLRTTNKKN